MSQIRGEEYYRAEMLKRVSEEELEEWLRRNPPPRKWQAGKYGWAFLEMPVGSLYTYLRKNLLGYTKPKSPKQNP